MSNNSSSDHSLLFDILKLLGVLAIYVLLLGSIQLFALYLLKKQFSISFYEEMSLTERLCFGILNTFVVLIIYQFQRRSFGLKPLSLCIDRKLLLKYAFLGMSLSLLLIGLIAIITSLDLRYTMHLNANFDVFTVFIYLIFFLIAAYNEELLCRGILMEYLCKENTTWVALLCSSILFTALHLGNPGLSLLAFTNLFCAGLILGLLYIYSGRNLVLSTIFHAGWNFFQGPVLGFAVSGFHLPNTFLSVESSTSPSAIRFGLEGTLACTYISVAFIFLLTGLLYLRNKQKVKIAA